MWNCFFCKVSCGVRQKKEAAQAATSCSEHVALEESAPGLSPISQSYFGRNRSPIPGQAVCLGCCTEGQSFGFSAYGLALPSVMAEGTGPRAVWKYLSAP